MILPAHFIVSWGVSGGPVPVLDGGAATDPPEADQSNYVDFSTSPPGWASWYNHMQGSVAEGSEFFIFIQDSPAEFATFFYVEV